MSIKHTILGLIWVGLMTTSAHAETFSSGSRSVNGQSVRYELRGASNASANITGETNSFEMWATVDEVDHQFIVHSNQLIWNGDVFPINGFNEVEIEIDYNDVAIAVDGEKIVP